MFVGTLIAMPMVIVRMSADYFVAADPGAADWPIYRGDPALSGVSAMNAVPLKVARIISWLASPS